jgi:serine/threonine-protein kinase
MPRRGFFVFVFFILVSPLLPPRSAAAADPVAESLFQEAIARMKAEQPARACPMLEASFKLEARSGTLIVLASCRELEGRTATAWALYKDAAALARAEGRLANAEKADRLSAEVEEKLAKLRIEAPETPPGVVFALDGRAIEEAMLGVSFAVDPGEHTLAASAPGHLDWSAKVTVNEGELFTTVVPPLPKIPDQAAGPPFRISKERPLAPEGIRAASTSAPPMPIPKEPPSIPPWVWFSFASSAAFGVSAASFYKKRMAIAATIEKTCGPDRAACPPDFAIKEEEAREMVSLGGVIGCGLVGLFGLGAGIAGIVIEPSKGAPSVALWSAGAGAVPAGVFASVQRRF